MSLQRPIATSFNGGELSPRMGGRVDTAIYGVGLEQAENFVPTVEGAIVKRPGFEYIRPAAPTASWLTQFRFNLTQDYVIEWSDGKLRFYTNDVRIETAPGVPYEVAVPYSAAEAPFVSCQQSFDRLYMDHAGHPPARLTRTSATTFVYEVLPFQNGPFADRNRDQAVTVTASAATGSVTISASAAIFLPGHVGAPFQIEAADFSTIPAWEAQTKDIKVGDVRRSEGKAYTAETTGTTGTVVLTHTTGAEWDGSNTKDANDKGPFGIRWAYRHDRFGMLVIDAVASDGRSATATVTRRLPDSVLTVPTWRWTHGAFSAAAGWPSVVIAWAGRLCHFKQFELLASVAGDYPNHAAYTASGIAPADLAFRRTLSTEDPVLWAMGDRKLIVGTASREIAIGAINAAQAVAGDNIEAVPQSFYGSERVFPVQIATNGVFVQRGGRKLRQAEYDFARDRYQAANMTVWCRHITRGGIRQMTFQKEPEELLVAVRGDGQLIVHPHAPEQEIKGFARIRHAGGRVLSAIACADAAGSDVAQAGSSSAYGRYQFTRGTWLNYYKRRFGQQGLDDAAILAKRANGQLQDRLMMDLTQDNARALRRGGHVPTNDALYLMHFAGPSDGLKVMDASADLPVSSVMRPASVAANPFLARMNVGQLRAWAARKMGGVPGTPAPAVAAIGDDAGEVLASSLARLDGEDAALSQALADLDPVRAREAVDDAGDAAGIEGGGSELDDVVKVDAMPPMRMGTRLASEVEVDAGLMQFKAGGDEYGVTERLQGVTEWNPAYSGRLVLWEAKDGRLVVADGHQRAGLARRIGDQQGRDIPLDVTILREADGVAAGDARMLAAAKNIAEGSGTAIDAAKVIREAGRDRVLSLVPPRSPLVREADALSSLSDEAFGAVVNGVVRPEQAAVIGRLLPDTPGAHSALIDLLAKTKPANQAQAESIVRQGIAAGFADGVQFDMFGEYNRMASLFIKRAKVLDRTLAKLREKRGAFRLASRKASLLEEGGNAIDRGASDAAAAESAQAIELIERLAHSDGPIGDALNKAARAHAEGRKIGDVVDELVDELGDIDLARAQAVAEAGPAPIETLAADELVAAGGDAPVDADTLSLFDTPDSPGVARQIDSLVHDAEAAIERADAIKPTRSPAPVDDELVQLDANARTAMTEGEPMIQLEEGVDAIPLRSLMDEFDAEDAAIGAARACM